MSNGEAPKASPQEAMRDYKHKAVVFGSRAYNNYNAFSEEMFSWLKNKDLSKGDVIFMSGMANAEKEHEDQRTGADAFIIRWCKEHGFPWTEHPADWRDVHSKGAVIRYNKQGPYNVLAGMWRNAEMAELATCGVSFYDGASTGTKDMIKRMDKLSKSVRVILTTDE